MFIIKYFSFFVLGVLAFGQPAIDFGAIGNRPFVNLPETPCYRPRNFLKPVLCFDQVLPESIDLCPCPQKTSTLRTLPTTTPTTTTVAASTKTAVTTTTPPPTTQSIPWGMLLIIFSR